MNKRSQQIIFIAMLILLSTGVAAGLRSWLHPPLHLQAATLLPSPAAMPEEGFELSFIESNPLNFNNARGYWLMFYFGSTRCAECKVDLQALGKMMAQFEGVDAQYKPKVIFVSLDPELDNAFMLKTYSESFHQDLAGVTGHKDELASLTKFFGVADNDHQAIQSSRIFIVDPQQRYMGYFAPPLDGDILYSDMKQLMHHLSRYHLGEKHSHDVTTD